MTLAGWGVLWLCFLRGTIDCSKKELERIKKMIRDKYEALGQMSHQEKVVV